MSFISQKTETEAPSSSPRPLCSALGHSFSRNTSPAAVRCVSCNSEVMESISDYSCCEAELEFNRNCEITFTANGTNFAFFKDETRSCTYPCGKLKEGAMRLEECAAVVGVMVCTDEMNVVEEEIQYRSQPCPVSQAPGNQGSVRLLLMTSMIVSLIVKKLVC